MLNGEILIQTEEHKTSYLINIKDNRTGIPPNILSRIFDPFFTTKDVGSGMGLGLTVCHNIIDAYNGGIKIISNENLGTTVTLIFQKSSSESKLISK